MTRKQTRELRIINKVFTKKDLIRLSSIIMSEYEKYESLSEYDTKKFLSRVEFDDNSSYESEGLELFDEDDVVDLKRSNKITIWAINRADQKDITLVLNRERGYGYLSVAGSDQNWVNGTYTLFDE